MIILWIFFYIVVYLGIGNATLIAFKSNELLFDYDDDAWDEGNDVIFVVFFPVPLIAYISKLFGNLLYKSITYIINKFKKNE